MRDFLFFFYQRRFFFAYLPFTPYKSANFRLVEATGDAPFFCI